MSNDGKQQEGVAPRDLTAWFVGRKSNVERWVDETCNRAIHKARSVVGEEIRGLSRRVEQMHELLDQLEQIVEAQESASHRKQKDEVEEPE